MSLDVFAVYNAIKRRRRGTSAEEDGEGAQSTVEDQDKQNYTLENGGFNCDENRNTENKDKGTKL